ncbi:unnamed protein product [Didymodactylos carnosus]|uniref:MACPF-like domain-containing protein n=1 Tax=Didymodactylos carnosus TaxID=1234261 RepID=A0A815PZK4_9BILA|nr:unnamed protein product [Didymodactylos carnosus]CAF4327342.1 unnamed protein product [Didymodactylos carnosus]
MAESSDRNHPAFSTPQQQELKIPGGTSQGAAAAAGEIFKATQLTSEQWQILFETRHLNKALFIDADKPKYSFEPVLQLRRGMLPKLKVDERSEIEAHLTYTERSKLFVENHFTEVEASFQCPFVAVSASYEENEKTAHRKEKRTVNTTCKWNFSRVIVKLDDPTTIEPTPEFVREVDKILTSPSHKQYAEFEKLFMKYGHKIPTEITLSGQLYHTDVTERVAKVNEKGHAQQVKGKFEVRINDVWGMKVGKGLGYGRGNESLNREENIYQKSSITFKATGGNVLLCQDPAKWIPTVEHWQNWDVIKNENFIPLYKILDEEQQRQIELLIPPSESKNVQKSPLRDSYSVTLQPTPTLSLTDRLQVHSSFGLIEILLAVLLLLKK